MASAGSNKEKKEEGEKKKAEAVRASLKEALELRERETSTRLDSLPRH